MVAVLRNPLTQQTVLINVLLDTGANNSSITEKVADLLLISGEKENYVLEVSGGDLKRYNTTYCHIQLGRPRRQIFQGHGGPRVTSPLRKFAI